MKIEIIEVRKIAADKGNVFASHDKTQVFSSEMYLGVGDSPENYIEITEDEAEQIKESQEKTANASN